MILTDEQINRAWDRSCVTDPTGSNQRFVFARAIESAATAPLLERIAEMEEMNAQLREQNTAMDKACADLEAHIEQIERELGTERAISFRDQVAQLERELDAVRKDAERWTHACKGNNKHINVCSWDNDAYEFVGYAMKKQSIDAIADAEISAIDAAKEQG